jgi:SAM-dependent MidA family methyltransferase
MTPRTAQGDTLRGFKAHAAAHVLSEPGMVDISADVNFKACAQVTLIETLLLIFSQIGTEQGALVQGPVPQVMSQSSHLNLMWIVE